MNKPFDPTPAAEVGCIRCRPAAPEGGHDDHCLAGKSLAMVYSPCQEFDGLHAPEEGLCRGTIFAELEKPFWGARRLK